MADFSQLPTLTHSGARRLLRRLELEAYASVVSAFRAQGQLSRDKKASLEHVAKCLGISAERHRAEIRRAVNDEVLGQVASCISGVETEKGWRREGQKLLSSLPPRLVSHQHPSLLPQTLTAITTATHKLKASLGTNMAAEARKVPTPIQNALRVILSHVPLKSEQPPATSHPGSIRPLPPQKMPSGVNQKSPQKHSVIKEEVDEVYTHPSPSKATAEQGKVYSQLESLLCEEQMMLVKGGGSKGGWGRFETSRLEGGQVKEKKDKEEKKGEEKDGVSVVGVSGSGGDVGASSEDTGVSNGGGSGEDYMAVREGCGSTGGNDRGERGGNPLPTLISSENRKHRLSPVPPRDLPPTKKQSLSDGKSSLDDTTSLSQPAPSIAEGHLINKTTLTTTTPSAVSMTTPVISVTPGETISSGGKPICTVETSTPTKYQTTTSRATPSTTQGPAKLTQSEAVDTWRGKTSLETVRVTSPSISSKMTVMSSSNATWLPLEQRMPTAPVSVTSSSFPHSPPQPQQLLPATPPQPLLPATTPQPLLPATTPQSQHLLPATPPQSQQLLPATPPRPQQLLPTTLPRPQQLLPTTPPQPQQLLPATPSQPQQLLPTTTPQPQQLLPTKPLQPQQLLSATTPRPQQPATPPQSQQLLPATHPRPQQLLPATPSQPQQLHPTTPPRPQQLLSATPSQPKQLLSATPSRPQQLLPATPSQPQQLLPATPPQPQQLLPATPPRPQQLLPTTPPQPQQLLPTTPPRLQQLLPLPRSQQKLPSVVPPQQLLSVTLSQSLLTSTSSPQLLPAVSTPPTPSVSSLPPPAKEEVDVFRANVVAPSIEVGSSPDTLMISDLIQDTSDSAVSSLASQLGLENAHLLNLDFMSFLQPSTDEGHTYTSSDSMPAFALPPLNIDPPVVPSSCSRLDMLCPMVPSTAPQSPHTPLLGIQFGKTGLGSCPSSSDNPVPTQAANFLACRPSIESKPSSLSLDKVIPTSLAGVTAQTTDETTPSISGKPADLVPPSVEYLDLTDIGSLMSSTDALKLLEGIPEDMAKSIQTIVQLDEQTWN